MKSRAQKLESKNMLSHLNKVLCFTLVSSLLSCGMPDDMGGTGRARKSDVDLPSLSTKKYVDDVKLTLKEDLSLVKCSNFSSLNLCRVFSSGQIDDSVVDKSTLDRAACRLGINTGSIVLENLNIAKGSVFAGKRSSDDYTDTVTYKLASDVISQHLILECKSITSIKDMQGTLGKKISLK